MLLNRSINTIHQSFFQQRVQTSGSNSTFLALWLRFLVAQIEKIIDYKITFRGACSHPCYLRFSPEPSSLS